MDNVTFRKNLIWLFEDQQDFYQKLRMALCKESFSLGVFSWMYQSENKHKFIKIQ